MAKKGSHKGYFICKTKQAERPIPILPEVKEMFLMFFTKNESIMDSLYNRVHVWELVKKVGERAKIGHKVFPHSLRATFVTILIEKGMDDPVALTQIMGWKKLDMASEYVRLSGASLKRKLEGIW
jgi:site-specific recombinase XerD